jgi:hypothetical protein
LAVAEVLAGCVSYFVSQQRTDDGRRSSVDQRKSQ